MTKSQLEHLGEIKKKYGISMAAFIRVLLKADMERPLVPEYTVVEEQRSEIVATKTRRIVTHAKPVSPARAALQAELNLVLERRKKKVDEAIVASAVRA